MRILFLESGSIWPYTLPQGLSELGHEIKISGPLTAENIPEIIQSFQPDFAVSIGWGYENTGEKPKWIRKAVQQAGIPLVYWAIEDPAFTEVFSLPLIAEMRPDFVFSLCPETVKLYNQKRIPAAQMEFGLNPRIHKPAPLRNELCNSIVVVANAYPDVLKTYPKHYRHTAIKILIAPLLENNFRIEFWGDDWDKMSPFGLAIPKEWIHGHIPYVNANQIYSSAAIVLGLQNYKHIVTQRSFEILGSGGFLLTLDTPAVRRLSPQIVISASPKQTLQLADYYLHHPEIRRQIQENSFKDIGSHTYRQRAEYMLKVLRERGILGTLQNEGNIASQTTPRKRSAPSILICSGNTGYKKIALTIDAGSTLPPGKKTVLDVLNAYGVKSTFFLTGQWIRQFPEFTKRIADSGHEIANHTVNHPDLTHLASEEIIQQIHDCDAILAKVIGRPASRLFRPPFGAYNARVLQAISDAGFKYTVYWSLDTLDWQQLPSTEILNRLMNNAKNGDIVLLHMAAKHTANAINLAIPLLKQQGYEFVTVSELLPDCK